MMKNGGSSSHWKQIVVAVGVALLAGGSAPWWWTAVTGSKEPTGPPPGGSSGVPSVDTGSPRDTLAGTYLMDSERTRVIVIAHLQGPTYRIEEASSPWPWEGTATRDGGQLSGEARFRMSQATMRVEGTIRGDGSVRVKYRFRTDESGRASDRVDHHIWIPKP